MKITIRNYKKHINQENIPLIETELAIHDVDNGWLIQKFYDWQEDYDWVDWNEFRDHWFKCTLCGAYEQGQCICYAR